MKFHHLARHNQQFLSTTNGSSASQRAQANVAGDLLKQHHQQQLAAAAAAAANLQQHLHNQFNLNRQQQQSFSDNELDEDEATFERQQDNFYADHLMRQQHQLATAAAAAAAAAVAQPGAGQQVSGGSNSLNQADLIQAESNDPEDNSNYLMDKNKKLFPQKLWELIHNPNIQHCLRWSQDGQRVYLNRQEFEQYYLKTANNQFHTQKAISFVRQMNMYGFRKVDDCYYENDNFRRDSKHLLKNMIRRHPNKGLFVGLVDHHQLNAAAARLQVNHQIQQQLVQDHHLQQQQNNQKQQQAAVAAHHERAAAAAAEQALRLNNYLNSNTQHQQQLQSHLAAAAAAAHQQQQHQQFKHSLEHQQQQHQSQVGENLTISNNRNQQKSPHQQSLVTAEQHKYKKSRLLDNFYLQAQAAEDHHHWSHLNQDQNRQHQLNRKNSIDNYNNLSGGLSSNGQHNGSASGQLSPRSLVARQTALHETLVRSLLQIKQQHHPTNVDASDLLANLTQHQHQSQQQRSLLESLASLSSAGTGSIVDPASNSPTERTATPPSRTPSPSLGEASCSSSSINNDDSIALNLARCSSNRDGQSMLNYNDSKMNRNHVDDDDEDEEENDQARVNGLAAAAAGSPLDGQKKVRKFLEDQMMNAVPMSLTMNTKDGPTKCHDAQQSWEQENGSPQSIKREPEDGDEQDENNQDDSTATNHHLPQKKRFKHFVVDNDGDQKQIGSSIKNPPIAVVSCESLAKSLVNQICDQEYVGGSNPEGEGSCEKLQLGDEALLTAAKIGQKFIQILIANAAKLAKSKSSVDKTEDENESNERTSISQVIDIEVQNILTALESVPSQLMTAVSSSIKNDQEPEENKEVIDDIKALESSDVEKRKDEE